MHMNIKMQCLNQSGSNCSWINGLKYYVYSVHDDTIYALFSILRIETKVITSLGYPDYSAATFIELWKNRTDNQPYFKENCTAAWTSFKHSQTKQSQINRWTSGATSILVHRAQRGYLQA
ncbi:hypothetical protein GCK32_018680 [Trichostrongylus colubriformis]|uniref:Uncharacterized protein n=1 Tax=Trichostrongylus colubriformis TaxID=6319 RepID=A0AAN8FWA8_TRICO